MTYPRFRHVVIVVATLMCLGYLTYRAAFTFNLTSPYAIFASVSLYVAECYSVLLFLLYFFQVWDPHEPSEMPALEGRTVDVLVPTYNEDVSLLRATLQACLAMDYPHKTYVLDDGKRPEVQALAEELGVVYLTRPDNRHAKAGNLNHALERTDGEFVVIFDADHVPERNFIHRLIGYFHDEQLGFVQTPHAFYNFDSFQARFDHKKRQYWEEGQLFYRVIQPGKNRWNAAIFAGSAAMFRRKALESIGYIASETITEDLHTSLRIHAKGWKSLGLSERLIVGQAAPDVTTFHSQRLRWGEGNLSIFAYDSPLTAAGLTLPQRLCYLGSMIHWAGGPFMLLIYLTPLLMLFTGIPPVAEFTWPLITIMSLYLLISLFGAYVSSNSYWSFWNSELYTMASFFTQIRGTLRAIFRRGKQSFVVTSKRGRQAKGTGRFIRPYVLLIVASVLALFWGWYRPLAGISDDYWRPLLASIWAVFHATLAFVVIRRSMWPENHRFAYRHTVYLPIAYETRGTAMRRFGISADLSEAGVALVAYERLPVGSDMRLTLHGAGETIECAGSVQSVKGLSRGGTQGAGGLSGFRHGVAFHDLTPGQTDALNRICLQYAVPLLYEEYDTSRERSRWQILTTWLDRGLRQRRLAARRHYRLPLVLQPEDGTMPAIYTVTDDISRTSIRALLDVPVAAGAEVNFLLPLPAGDVRGKARVLRVLAHRVGSHDYHMCILELMSFEDQGRVALQNLLAPAETAEMDAVLNPDAEPVRVPMLRPVMLGVMALIPLLVVLAALFHYVHRDDLFLLDVAQRGGPLTVEQESRLDGVFQRTMAQPRPDQDRLVLLDEAMIRLGRLDRVADVARVLALRDRQNNDLQLALARAYSNSQEYAKAEVEYQRLYMRMQRGQLTPLQQRELLLAAARSAVHAGHLDDAVVRFRELFKLDKPDVALRDEFAGVLTQATHYGEAVQILQTGDLDFDGRLLLVTAYLMARDYEAAETEARRVLKEKPADPRAEILLAAVMAGKKNYAAARLIYDRVLRAYPNNPEIRLRLAQLALSSKAYDQALPLFQQLLEKGQATPEVVHGYVDAAASAGDPGDIDKPTVLKIAAAALDKPGDDATFLARLAWVLQRVKENDKSVEVLERALALQPKDAAIRKQYVGLLLTAGRWQDAIDFLKSGAEDRLARELLVSLYLKKQDFAAAEKEARAILKDYPDDRGIQQLLADILAWNKDYPQALRMLEMLAKADPKDVEVQARIAEVTLWSGDYPAALARYQQLLATSFDQPKLWPGFVDAAASAKELTAADLATALRIAERTIADPPRDAAFLGRLAWVLYRGDEREQSGQLIDRAVALDPKEPAARRELAGVLAALGKYPEAARLFQGLTLTRADRYQLANIYAAEKDFDAAEMQARVLLKEEPTDKKAQRLLADVLTWKRDYPQALAVLRKMAAAAPDETPLQARLAEVTLWSGDYPAALAIYQKLLEASFDQPDLWRGFVDAAAGTATLAETQVKLADRVYEATIADPPANALFLARLAWILNRAGDKTRSSTLIDRAVKLDPREPAVRRELAGVLAALGKYPEALTMYKGLDLSVADRFRLVGIYSGDTDFAAAETEARAILKLRPTDARARMQLADVLSWRGKYQEAAAIYRQLLDADPGNAALAVKLADVALWSGDYDSALRQYREILAKDPRQPHLYPSLIDAASSATELDGLSKKTVLHIYEQALESKPKDPRYLSRLAWVLNRVKEPKKGIPLLERALNLDPASRPIKLQLAEAQYAAGNFAAAEKLYAELLRTKSK